VTRDSLSEKRRGVGQRVRPLFFKFSFLIGVVFLFSEASGSPHSKKKERP
jgi:hypothetical protein